MTREEAIKVLNNFSIDFRNSGGFEAMEALKIAILALRPVSREQADCHNAGTTSKIVDCSQYKPGRVLTNADRIRAMTDEELAEFISRIEIGDFGPQVYGKTFCDLCSGQYECDDCRLWWLQQPTEENT